MSEQEPQISELRKQILELRIALSTRRRNRIIILCAAAVLTPLVIYAANITKPHNFTAGNPAVATEVNSNFDTLYNKINDNTKYLGTYCGSTAATTTGSISGYVAAKNLCVTACSSANAHMCSGHEISVTLQQGIAMPATGLWISSYVATGTGANVMDCNGWQNGTATYSALFYDGVTNSRPNVATCDTMMRVACCQ